MPCPSIRLVDDHTVLDTLMEFLSQPYVLRLEHGVLSRLFPLVFRTFRVNAQEHSSVQHTCNTRFSQNVR